MKMNNSDLDGLFSEGWVINEKRKSSKTAGLKSGAQANADHLPYSEYPENFAPEDYRTKASYSKTQKDRERELLRGYCGDDRAEVNERMNAHEQQMTYDRLSCPKTTATAGRVQEQIRNPIVAATYSSLPPEEELWTPKKTRTSKEQTKNDNILSRPKALWNTDGTKVDLPKFGRDLIKTLPKEKTPKLDSGFAPRSTAAAQGLAAPPPRKLSTRNSDSNALGKGRNFYGNPVTESNARISRNEGNLANRLDENNQENHGGTQEDPLLTPGRTTPGIRPDGSRADAPNNSGDAALNPNGDHFPEKRRANSFSDIQAFHLASQPMKRKCSLQSLNSATSMNSAGTNRYPLRSTLINQANPTIPFRGTSKKPDEIHKKFQDSPKLPVRPTQNKDDPTPDVFQNAYRSVATLSPLHGDATVKNNKIRGSIIRSLSEEKKLPRRMSAAMALQFAQEQVGKDGNANAFMEEQTREAMRKVEDLVKSGALSREEGRILAKEANRESNRDGNTKGTSSGLPPQQQGEGLVSGLLNSVRKNNSKGNKTISRSAEDREEREWLRKVQPGSKKLTKINTTDLDPEVRDRLHNIISKRQQENQAKNRVSGMNEHDLYDLTEHFQFSTVAEKFKFDKKVAESHNTSTTISTNIDGISSSSDAASSHADVSRPETWSHLMINLDSLEKKITQKRIPLKTLDKNTLNEQGPASNLTSLNGKPNPLIGVDNGKTASRTPSKVSAKNQALYDEIERSFVPARMEEVVWILVLVCSKASNNQNLRHRMQHLFLPDMIPLLRKLNVPIKTLITSDLIRRRFEMHCPLIYQEACKYPMNSTAKRKSLNNKKGKKSDKNVIDESDGSHDESQENDHKLEKKCILDQKEEIIIQMRDLLMKKEFVKTAVTMDKLKYAKDNPEAIKLDSDSDSNILSNNSEINNAVQKGYTDDGGYTTSATGTYTSADNENGTGNTTAADIFTEACDTFMETLNKPTKNRIPSKYPSMPVLEERLRDSRPSSSRSGSRPGSGTPLPGSRPRSADLRFLGLSGKRKKPKVNTKKRLSAEEYEAMLSGLTAEMSDAELLSQWNYHKTVPIPETPAPVRKKSANVGSLNASFKPVRKLGDEAWDSDLM